MSMQDADVCVCVLFSYCGIMLRDLKYSVVLNCCSYTEYIGRCCSVSPYLFLCFECSNRESVGHHIRHAACSNQLQMHRIVMFTFSTKSRSWVRLMSYLTEEKINNETNWAESGIQLEKSLMDTNAPQETFFALALSPYRLSIMNAPRQTEGSDIFND